MLANEIFKNDMYELMGNKTHARERISGEAKKKLSEISEAIRQKDYSDSEVCQMIFDFTKKLKKEKGKKVYGYLSKPLKKDVDKIFITLAADPDIQKLYGEWCEMQKKIVGIYKDADVKFPPLWENKEFHKIRNAIVKECVKLGNDRLFINEQSENREANKEDDQDADIEIHEETYRDEEPENDQSYEMNDYQKGEVAMSVAKLFYRLSRIVESDTHQKMEGFNKTIVDSKERIKEMKKKQSLGIKMG